jgi:two-component system response regulator PilR (NtrC family)
LANILVCDDERSLCQMLEIDLRKEGYKVETVNNREDAKKKIASAIFDVIVTDIRMPQTSDGMEVLHYARKVSPESSVILMTALAELETAIQAVRAGAFEYIVKQPGRINDAIKVAISRALEHTQLKRQNFALRRDAASRNSLDQITGCSKAILKLKDTIRTVAATGSSVVIQGESGVGKELVARAIHACSPRASEAFVSVNCGAFPETLLESELFGYMKGSFTGANQNKRGLFEVAHEGTLFLDEISEMPVTMQVKLLRTLQERSVRPIGGSSETPVDVRIIAATNKDLSQMVLENIFREDLYYRISVIPIQVQPLRERIEDIPLLANEFLKRFSSANNKVIHRIEEKSLKLLMSHGWPGNVRQLQNTIERAVAMETSDELHVELPEERTSHSTVTTKVTSEGVEFEKVIANLEMSLLQSAMQQANGVQTRAAELLNISYRSFRHLMKKYDL